MKEAFLKKFREAILRKFKKTDEQNIFRTNMCLFYQVYSNNSNPIDVIKI